MASQIPSSMQALRLHPDKSLRFETAPVPVPVLTQVLIRVSAAAITRSELTWGETLSQSFPIPAHDVSGTVISAPPASRFKTGDEVFGLVAFGRNGAAAEYALAREEELSLKPKNLTHEEAAAIPLSSLSAWQALFDHGKLKSGMRLLVTAASGGVGVMGVQLGKWAGAHVIGTCSAKNVDLVRDLGVDEVIDYSNGGYEKWAETTAEKLEESGIDFLFDCIGGETLRKSLGVVKSGGVVVSVAEPFKHDWKEVEVRRNDNVTMTYFIVKPDGSILENIRDLVENGDVKPVIDRAMRLSEGQEAFDVLEKGHVQGKIVLKV